MRQLASELYNVTWRPLHAHTHRRTTFDLTQEQPIIRLGRHSGSDSTDIREYFVGDETTIKADLVTCIEVHE